MSEKGNLYNQLSMFFCIKQSLAHTTVWMFLSIIAFGLFFIPSSVFAYVVTLNPPQSNVENGALVTFTGTVVIPCGIHDIACFPHPVSDVTVQIIDQVSNMAITEDVTDITGAFSAQWTAEYRDNSYLIFALAHTPGNATRTNQYPLSVNPPHVENNIKLILEPPLPSTQVDIGQTVTLSGSLIADHKFDKRIKLVIDGTTKAVEHTDQNGKFSIPWIPQSQDQGGHQIYVLYDEYYEVKSESYNVDVLPPIPYTVKIIADATKGIVPFWVHFDAKISGGKAPYNFLWTIDGKTSTEQSFDKKFVTADNYLVSLTVTDSESQTRFADPITIFAKKSTLNPQIIMDQKNVKEGDTVTFAAKVNDATRVKSYEWKIDGEKPISLSKDASFVFADDGSYLVSLSVVDTDGKPYSTTKSVSVLNVPPEITSSLQNYEIESGKPLPLNVLFTDPGIEDNFTIEFFVGEQKLDVRHQNSPEPTSFSFDLNPGSYDAKVVVTDNYGGKDEKHFQIIIKESRLPIEILIGSIIAAGVGGGYGLKKYHDMTHNKIPRIEIRVLRSGIER